MSGATPKINFRSQIGHTNSPHHRASGVPFSVARGSPGKLKVHDDGISMNLIQLACRRLSAKGWQLRHVAGDAPCLIESQRLGDCSIALIGVTADIGKSLSFRVRK